MHCLRARVMRHTEKSWLLRRSSELTPEAAGSYVIYQSLQAGNSTVAGFPASFAFVGTEPQRRGEKGGVRGGKWGLMVLPRNCSAADGSSASAERRAHLRSVLVSLTAPFTQDAFLEGHRLRR